MKTEQEKAKELKQAKKDAIRIAKRTWLSL